MSSDLRAVSDDDLIAYKRGDLRGVSTEGLLAIKRARGGATAVAERPKPADTSTLPEDPIARELSGGRPTLPSTPDLGPPRTRPTQPLTVAEAGRMRPSGSTPSPTDPVLSATDRYADPAAQKFTGGIRRVLGNPLAPNEVLRGAGDVVGGGLGYLTAPLMGTYEAAMGRGPVGVTERTHDTSASGTLLHALRQTRDLPLTFIPEGVRTGVDVGAEGLEAVGGPKVSEADRQRIADVGMAALPFARPAARAIRGAPAAIDAGLTRAVARDVPVPEGGLPPVVERGGPLPRDLRRPAPTETMEPALGRAVAPTHNTKPVESKAPSRAAERLVRGGVDKALQDRAPMKPGESAVDVGFAGIEGEMRAAARRAADADLASAAAEAPEGSVNRRTYVEELRRRELPVPDSLADELASDASRRAAGPEAKPVSTTPETAPRAQPAPAVGGPRAPVEPTVPAPEAPRASTPKAPPAAQPPVAEPPLVQRMRQGESSEAWNRATTEERKAANTWAIDQAKARGQKGPYKFGREIVEGEIGDGPREGPTLGSFGGAAGPDPIGAAERPWAHGVASLGAKAAEAFPRTAGVLRAGYDKVFKSPEARIGAEFEGAIRAGRARTRDLEYDADLAVRELRSVAKGVSKEQAAEIGKSLNSEPADLSTLTPEQRASVENVRTKLQDLRRREADAGIRSEETQTEYPQGRLSRILKDPVDRLFGRQGGIRTTGYKTAHDMYGAKVRLTEAEARALVPEGAPLRYLKAEGDTTLVKFTDSPEGRAARDAFLGNVEAKLTKAKADLGALSTRAMNVGGNVSEAKALHAASLDVPRIGTVLKEKFDPVPRDVAERIFIDDPVPRLKATMGKSARNVGAQETLGDIAKLVDKDGPIAQAVPDGIARGAEAASAPEGFTYVNGESYGPLSGKYVRKNVAEYVKGAFGKEQITNAQGVQRALMERFKVARLLYNPRQWFRQFVSNMENENLMGMSNWSPEWIAHTAKAVRAMRRSSPYYRELVSNRFLDPAYVTDAELGLVERTLSGTQGNTGYRITKAILTGSLSETAPTKLARVEGGLGRMFGLADGLMKSKGYVFAREQLGMSPTEAAAYVRKWTPSPEAVSDLVKRYSTNTILGDPWARYRAEQLRINLQAAAEKPVRLGMNLAQKNLIRGASVALGASALTGDEEEALSNEQGTGALALGRDDAGRPLSLDYSFLSTIGDWRFAPPSEVGKRGDYEFERAWDISGFGDNPILGLASEAKTGRDKWGRTTSPDGTTSGRAAALGRTFLKSWVPSLATNHREKLMAAWAERPYSPNQPVQTKSQAVLDVFFGFKLTPLDAEQALQKIQRQGARAIDDIESNYKRQIIRGEEPDEERAVMLAELLQQEYEERAAPLERLSEEQGRPR